MAVSMSSSIWSFSGFVFVIPPKCVVGRCWVAVGLGLGICLGSDNKGGVKIAVVEALVRWSEMN